MLSIVLSETKAKLSPEVKLEADSSYKYHSAQAPYSSVPIIDFIHLISSQIKQEKQKDWKYKHESCTKYAICGLQLSTSMEVKLIFLLCQWCHLDQSWCVQSMHTECSVMQYVLWTLTFQSVSHWHLWCLLRQFSKPCRTCYFFRSPATENLVQQLLWNCLRTTAGYAGTYTDKKKHQKGKSLKTFI